MGGSGRFPAVAPKADAGSDTDKNTANKHRGSIRIQSGTPLSEWIWC